jgi:hypothetical protein
MTAVLKILADIFGSPWFLGHPIDARAWETLATVLGIAVAVSCPPVYGFVKSANRFPKRGF